MAAARDATKIVKVEETIAPLYVCVSLCDWCATYNYITTTTLLLYPSLNANPRHSLARIASFSA